MVVVFICYMAKDKQKELIKDMIESGKIKLLKDIFDYYPISPVITYLKTNHKTLYEHLQDADKFRTGTVFSIGDYFGVDETAIMMLIVNQRMADKKRRRK